LHNKNSIITLFCAALAFAVLYIPQPILPLLADFYNSDMSTASLLITVTMVPLGLAPMVYGYMLEHVSARSLLLWGFVLLGFSFVLMLLASNIHQLIIIRAIQGIILPAIITALMTYSAISAPKGQVRRFLSIYIATTIIGGFCGRILTGLFIDLLGWNLTLVFWLCLIVFAIILLRRMDSDAEAKFSKPNLSILRQVVSRPGFRQIYGIVFLMFFVFATVLNFLPFRLKQITPDISEATIAMIYIAYLIGAIISFNISRIIRMLGGDFKTLLAGLIIYCSGSILFFTAELLLAFIAMLLFCAGMFLMHATLSGLVNYLAEKSHGVVNGFYLSSYYLGGALGSWLPGFIYQKHGWRSMLLLLMIILIMILFLYIQLQNKKVLQQKPDSLE